MPNPAPGKVRPRINPLPLSDRISKPSSSNATDYTKSHTQCYKRRFRETRVPARERHSDRETRPRRASPSKRPPLRPGVPHLKLDTSMANKICIKENQILSSPTSIEQYPKGSSKIPQIRKSRFAEAVIGEFPAQNLRKIAPGARASNVRSFSGLVKDQARDGSWLEQWEARKMIAAEIEWREDVELLGKGLSIAQLLEMKVERRGQASDALIYAQHVLGQTLPTKFICEVPTQVRVSPTEIKVGWDVDQHRSAPLELLPTPVSSGTGSTPSVENPRCFSAGQDLLSSLLSPNSDSRNPFFPPKSAGSQSQPDIESCVGTRCLESLQKEIVERMRRKSLGTVTEHW